MSESLAPPPPTPAPPEGGPKPTPKTPKKVELSKEVTVGLASAKQRIEHQKQSGRKVEEMELMEERIREMSRLKMTEDRSKWEGRFPGITGLASRFWKFSFGEVATYNKEKNHATKLLAESGIQITSLPHDFLERVDDLARQNVASRRTGVRKRAWGAIRDVFHEATFTEKELHQERLEIIKTLRQVAENPTDPNLQQFIRNNANLVSHFGDVLTGDYQAAEALAKRVNSEFGNDVIHSVVGEKTTTTAEQLKGPVADFFKQQIITPLLKEGLTNKGISESTLGNARRQLQDFFFSDRFIDWYNDPANQNIKDKLNLSLSYGSDLIPIIQETLLPQLLQAREHMVAAGNLDNYVNEMVLKVNVGTVEAGQKGVINEGLADRIATRSITNRRVHEIYRNMQQHNRPSRLVPDTYLEASVNRANLLSHLYRTATNPTIAGIATAGLLYGGMSALRLGGKVIVPWIGGSAVAGVLRGLQERRAFSREYEEYGVEKELGYKDPQSTRNGIPRRREQMQKLEFNKLEMERDLTRPMKGLVDQIQKGQDLSAAGVTELMGLIANTKARFNLMDNEGFGLLAARHPQFYQKDRTDLELTRAKASAALRNFLNNHPNRLNEVQQQLGMQNTIPDAIIDQLTQAQESFLYRGVGLNPNIQTAFGTLNQNVDSMESRGRAFQRARNVRTATAFAGTFAAGLVSGLVTQEMLTVKGRLDGRTDVGSSVLENVFSGKSPNHWFDGGRMEGFGEDSLKELKSATSPMDVELSKGAVLLHTDGSGNYQFLDATTKNPFTTPPVKLVDDVHGPRIVIEGQLSQLPQPVKDALFQKDWKTTEFSDGRVPGFGVDYAQDLYKNGGKFEIDNGIWAGVRVEPDGTRILELTDPAGVKISSPTIYLESDGRLTVLQDFNKLPPNIKHIFEQSTGWNHAKRIGWDIPGVNQDKVEQFFRDPIKYGGRLGVSKDLFLQTSNELENGDRPIRFMDLQQRTIPAPPMWHKADGSIVIAGDWKDVPAQIKPIIDSWDKASTRDHDLRFWLAEIAKGGVKTAADEDIVHGNFVLNSHDIHEVINQVALIDPKTHQPIIDPVTGLTKTAPMSYDPWAEMLGRKDPFTGQIEVGKMSFLFKPADIQLHGMLQQDGKFHLIDKFYGNDNVTPAEWTRIIGEMNQEGWDIQKAPDGWIVTPPEAQVYTPPGVTEVLPPPPEWKFHVDAYPPIIPIREQEAMIPIPPVYRKPLEAPETPEEKIIIDSLGYGETSAALKGVMEQNRSRTLKDNPDAELDTYKETEMYFARQDQGYMQEVQSLASQISQPPSENLRAVVCIPVAGHQEGDNIYTTLENYTYQDLPKDQFEVLLFVNQPNVDKQGKPVKPDKTLQEIERFRQKYPDMPVRVIQKVLPIEQAKISRIRKLLTDTALYRQHQRGPQAGEIILISNDADNKGVAPTYVSHFINKFEQNPSTECLVGQLDWDPEDYSKYPDVFIGTRLFQFLNVVGRRASLSRGRDASDIRKTSSGANSAYKGSIYAAIGGYPELAQGEDVAIGLAIAAARGRNGEDNWSTFGVANPRVSRIYTSARRAIKALEQGYAPVVQWNMGEFSAFDDEIRNLKAGTGKDIDYNDPSQVAEVQKRLELVINKTLDVYAAAENRAGGEQIHKTSGYLGEALRLLGIHTEYSGNQLQITNMPVITRRLQRYQKIGVLLRDIKSGKGTPEMKEELHRLEESYHEVLNKPLVSKPGIVIQPDIKKNPEASPLLKTDPNAELDNTVVVPEYLRKQDPIYLEELQMLNQQIGEEMNPNTEIVACIPVAGAQESSNIYKTLKSYSQQNLDPSKFEVLLFVNSSETAAASKQAEIQRTLQEIQRAKADFPKLNVRVASTTIPNNQVLIGNIRKTLTDLALIRKEETGIDRDILLLSNDADNEGLDPTYLETYVNYIRTNPEKDGAVGNLLYDPQTYVRFPTIHAKTELVNSLDRQGFINGNVDLFGNNSVMKSSIYSAIGGYPPSLKTGEQEWTGNTIRELRQKRTTLGYAGDGTLLVTNARRGLISYLENRSTQLEFGNEEAEARMRQLDLTSYPMFDWSNPVEVDKVKKEIETSLDQVIAEYEQGDRLGKDASFYRTNLAKMGIQYQVIGDPKDPGSKIEVTDLSGFIQRQKKMRELIESGETNMAIVYKETENLAA